MHMRILCLHGLGSGADNNTARRIREGIADCEVLAPEIPHDPDEAVHFLHDVVKKFNPDIIVGNSLGGFYALMFEGPWKILVNPALNPSKDIGKSVGKGIHRFHKKRSDGESEYVINDEYLSKLERLSKHLNDDIMDYEQSSETYLLFGLDDAVVSHYRDALASDDFLNSHIIGIEGAGHRLTDDEIDSNVIPLIRGLKLIDD